jgi:hypothetical protein
MLREFRMLVVCLLQEEEGMEMQVGRKEIYT